MEYGLHLVFTFFLLCNGETGEETNLENPDKETENGMRDER